MSLLNCDSDCTLVEFARRHNVHQRHLWLPLDAALPSRASKHTTVTVDADTPIALLDSSTNSISFDKHSICVKLQVADALSCDRTSVKIDPSSTPSGCTVFVRWDRRGTKRLRAPTQVLHFEREKEKPSSSSRSSVTGAKRSRADDVESSVDASTLADTLRGKQHRISLLQRSTEDLQRRLSAAIQSRGRPLNPRSLHILSSTLSNIRHRSAQPPLHFVLPADGESLEAGGVRWARSNRRILSRVFRGSSSTERSEACKYSDGSRQVRFYFIEDVLLRRPSRWVTPSQEEVARESAAEGLEDAASPSPIASDDVVFLLKDKVLEDMSNYAERGYRIVFLEHYPVLHHASRFSVEKTLAPVVRLCRECCPHLTVTVVLSAMSYVTATQRQGMELSFVVPQAGLLRFFVTAMNTSLQPDAKTSSIVGCSAKGSDLLNALHRDAARNVCLRYVDVSTLQ
ncbi:hypothetical protein ABL78_4989 [Leptomonas seymouri]|uniref:Uncharacterized protein n=1 Tax=Leptomonas seymouri TaxID=5684 RepID=A0A0N0P518_LEPSE|nr:hypothetical protein ABL78_4989 [Leptomonas seymouri]|eukprot:KPI85946.1 hypothetical protein ABL78_4989 [Leptomonas seymouri]